MTSIKQALENAELDAAAIAMTTSTIDPNAVTLKMGWYSRRAWRCDPVQRKEHFSELRAERKARWKEVSTNGIPALVGWKPRKWERAPRERKSGGGLFNLLMPATM